MNLQQDFDDALREVYDGQLIDKDHRLEFMKWWLLGIMEGAIRSRNRKLCIEIYSFFIKHNIKDSALFNRLLN